ncbi:MAG: hypothetical protein Q8881_03105 [Sweet potato little leaf phytoplasma]|nr:hypothetical protein [Sweet potato little leaf phytoplasma]
MHLGTFPPKRTNFCRILHSKVVSDETAEFPPNFALVDISPQNGRIFVVFRTRDVSNETAE